MAWQRLWIPIPTAPLPPAPSVLRNSMALIQTNLKYAWINLGKHLPLRASRTTSLAQYKPMHYLFLRLCACAKIFRTSSCARPSHRPLPVMSKDSVLRFGKGCEHIFATRKRLWLLSPQPHPAPSSLAPGPGGSTIGWLVEGRLKDVKERWSKDVKEIWTIFL